MTTTGTMARNHRFEVPAWAVVLALIAFAGIQVVVHTTLAHGEDALHSPLRVFLGLLVGTILATWIVLIGYVNRDAGRRGMSRTLWTLVATFVPNGIGLVLYFVLRRPVETVCPQCGAAVAEKANYCPRCSHRLALVCPRCGQAVGAGDSYCPNCGNPLRKAEPEPESSGADRR